MIRLRVCDGRPERDDGDVSPGMDLTKANALKFPAGPGEATENHFTFASGYPGPPDPH